MKSPLFSRFEDNLRPLSRFWELWRSKMRFGQNVLRMTWKVRFVQFLWRAHCFPVLKRFWGLFHDCENFDAPKCDLAKTCSAWPEKSVLYNFYGERTVFLCWRELEAMTILKTLTIQNAIWPKRAAHDLKCVFCTLFIESALFPVLKRIWSQCDDFENFDAPNCDLAKKSCAWPEKSVLYNFHGERIVFPFWREFYASVTILRTLTLANAIWPKRAPQHRKRAFCTIFMESAQFSCVEEN